jgi:hypothetical protein
MVRRMQIGNMYTRKDVHDIFEPNTPFRSGTGTWGLQGIIKIPNRINDYVFFVTGQ